MVRTNRNLLKRKKIKYNKMETEILPTRPTQYLYIPEYIYPNQLCHTTHTYTKTHMAMSVRMAATHTHTDTHDMPVMSPKAKGNKTIITKSKNKKKHVTSCLPALNKGTHSLLFFLFFILIFCCYCS